MSKTSGFFWGLLAGAAAGAILGILYAPDKGSETRKRIRQKFNDISDEVRNAFDDLTEGVDDLTGSQAGQPFPENEPKTARKRGRPGKTQI